MYTVNAEQEYAYYSEYNFSKDEARDLSCPYCGAEEIVCIDDGVSLGCLVRCWMCKREFNNTENCWKFRIINR